MKKGLPVLRNIFNNIIMHRYEWGAIQFITTSQKSNPAIVQHTIAACTI